MLIVDAFSTTAVFILKTTSLNTKISGGSVHTKMSVLGPTSEIGLLLLCSILIVRTPSLQHVALSVVDVLNCAYDMTSRPP